MSKTIHWRVKRDGHIRAACSDRIKYRPATVARVVDKVTCKRCKKKIEEVQAVGATVQTV